MNLYKELGLESSFIYDVPNFLICVIAVIIAGALVRLPRIYFAILIAHCFLPFLLNDVIFPTSYMPDQFRYISSVMDIRSGEPLSEKSGSVAIASWLLALIPLPTVLTTQSLGFFNKFIFILLFAFLYRKEILNRFSAYFLLLYPSVALYTSLSLRDGLIFYCMMLIAYSAIKRNYFWMIIFITPLAFIKFQNFFIMLALFPFALLNIGQKGLSVRNGFAILAVSIFVFVVSFPVAVPLINTYRLAMYHEDGGTNVNELPLITGFFDFFTIGITSGFYFLAKPFPWESVNVFQLIQVFENLIILLIILKLTVIAWVNNTRYSIFWMLLFFFSLSLYGMVVFNYGTAARYRFPFISLYVVFVAYSCSISRVFKFRF